MEVDKVFKETESDMRRIVTRLSEFYIYYYLTEIHDAEEFYMDRNRVTNSLHDSFFYYGINEIIGEASLVSTAGPPNEPLKEEPEEEIDRILRSNGIEDVEMVKAIMGSRINSSAFSKLNFRNIERYVNGFSEPERALKASKEVFDSGITSDSIGGELWSNITRVVMEREEMTNTMWVDMCFQLEHNAGQWMDSSGIDEEELNRIADSFGEYESELFGSKVKEIRKENMTTAVYNTVIPKLLDQRREENFSDMFRFLSKEDSRVRSYRHILR